MASILGSFAGRVRGSIESGDSLTSKATKYAELLLSPGDPREALLIGEAARWTAAVGQDHLMFFTADEMEYLCAVCGLADIAENDGQAGVCAVASALSLVGERALTRLCRFIGRPPLIVPYESDLEEEEVERARDAQSSEKWWSVTQMGLDLVLKLAAELDHPVAGRITACEGFGELASGLLRLSLRKRETSPHGGWTAVCEAAEVALEALLRRGGAEALGREGCAPLRTEAADKGGDGVVPQTLLDMLEAPEAVAPAPKLCGAGCGELGAKTCSRCKAVRYCSRDCQSLAWKNGHKLECGGEVAA
eukprot:CAMPEP_0170150276 /NCGR_PEP_ID=MMETSP0033_2-20121228/45823_1 /TAXON_ID=195969 /ORGANISM="Dolichomastix tenuilepis, Strain CCMP3274" /LENGTH=305 /DNA_ID=CAMNT_0010387289 /DNA_START=56 /DNA_END=976 /DNA_ORIENTATION=-